MKLVSTRATALNLPTDDVIGTPILNLALAGFLIRRILSLLINGMLGSPNLNSTSWNAAIHIALIINPK